MRRSIFVAAVLSFSLTALAGCVTTPSGDDEVASDGAAAVTDSATEAVELTSAAHALAGRYYAAPLPIGGIARLSLAKDGTYTAEVEAGTRQICFVAPCLLSESGHWSATRGKGGARRLRLRPAGEPEVVYDAAKTATTLTLTRNGQVQTLAALGAEDCLDDADCDADEQCGPKVCLMWCAEDDPFCCGTSTCTPKAPSPPPPVCFGAWVDSFGTCRAPNDGVYDASCCAGPTCGNAQCALGEVCCNALSGICAQPDEVCTQ